MSTHDPHAAPAPDPRVAAYLTRRGLQGASASWLAGDASDRRYVRVEAAGGRPIVLAVHAEPFDPAALPFLNVARLFGAIGLRIPAVLDTAGDLGIVALEDLGDVTLQAHLGGCRPAEVAPWYREAVDLLLALQQGGRAQASDAFLPYRLTFDVEKLTWELDFFVRHFLEAHRRAALRPAERDALAAEWRQIAGELAAEPRVLCHRDYHSRNLMVHDGRLVLIDFQDARMGPDTYDLVSLLRDSYVRLPDEEVDRAIARFQAAVGGPPDAREFRRRFDLMAVQRNLKALGTFGYQVAVRGRRQYAESIPRTLEYVRTNLERYARFGRLRDLLAAHLAELR
ncbi:MAG TPA: phosphotransferase [Vicinamibacterales bacterium]|nr:phosphotransferase [Vicinamibacterales bacterium]